MLTHAAMTCTLALLLVLLFFVHVDNLCVRTNTRIYFYHLSAMIHVLTSILLYHIFIRYVYYCDTAVCRYSVCCIDLCARLHCRLRYSSARLQTTKFKLSTNETSDLSRIGLYNNSSISSAYITPAIASFVQQQQLCVW